MCAWILGAQAHFLHLNHLADRKESNLRIDLFEKYILENKLDQRPSLKHHRNSSNSNKKLFFLHLPICVLLYVSKNIKPFHQQNNQIFMFCFLYLKKLFIFIVLFVFIAGCMYYMSHIRQQKNFSYKINVMNHIANKESK